MGCILVTTQIDAGLVSCVFVLCAALVCLPYANADECIARHANTNAPGELLVNIVYWFTISTLRWRVR